VSVPRPAEFNVRTPEQVEAVARAPADDQLAAVTRVAAYTGLRLGELCALRWRDLDFVGGNVRVSRSHGRRGGEGATKSGRARSVPLSPQAARAFDALSRRELWTRDDDRVFVNSVGGPVSGDVMLRGARPGRPAPVADEAQPDPLP
jgi:integrase